MEDYNLKIKLLLPHFLAVTIGTTTLYALLRWGLSIQAGLFDLKLEMWELWLPVVLAAIPVLIWLRPRFRALTFYTRNEDNLRFAFQLLAYCTLLAMLITSQKFLTKATGKLVTVESVNNIETQQRARYYTIEDFDIAPGLASLYPYVSASGNRNESLNIDLYFVLPIVQKGDVISTSRGWKYWYGLKFHRRIDNTTSDEEKDAEYRQFIESCAAKLDSLDFHQVSYFENLPTSEDRERYLKAIAEGMKETPPENCLVLQPATGPYEARSGNLFIWIFGSFGIGLAVFLLALIWPGFEEAEYERLQRGEKPDEDILMDILRFLVPRGNHFVTSLMIDLNILVFLVMVFSGVSPVSPSGEELLRWGGNRAQETMGGEWWRLLTCTFLHDGIMHLALNIYGLVIAAMFVEPILGRVRYAILYLVSGICASLASLMWYDNTVSIGASGAIFGVYGAVLGLLLTKAFPQREKKQIFAFIGVYVGINLIWGIEGGVDNAAHIGGLVSGAALGFILFYLGGKKTNQEKVD